MSQTHKLTHQTVVLAVVAMAVARPAFSQTYSITDLGTLGGPSKHGNRNEHLG